MLPYVSNGPVWNIILVMAGGSLGALARYGAALLSARLWGTSFPYGTLLVNLSGCLLIGLLYGLGERSDLVTPADRLFFITGFLGALTTFSSFALESLLTGGSGMYGAAVVNFILNNAGGFLLVILGMQCARLLVR